MTSIKSHSGRNTRRTEPTTNLVPVAGSKNPRLYEKMQTAIAVCHSFDEVKAIADQAAAIAAYHKQIKDDVAVR